MENYTPRVDWFCTECGTKNDNGARFCKSCGAPKKDLNFAQQPPMPYGVGGAYSPSAPTQKQVSPARKAGLIVALVGLAVFAVCTIVLLIITLSTMYSFTDTSTVVSTLGWVDSIALAVAGVGYIVAGASAKGGLHITTGVFLILPLALALFALALPRVVFSSADAYLVYSYLLTFSLVLYLLFLAISQFKVNVGVAVIILVAFIVRFVSAVWQLADQFSYYEVMYSSEATYIAVTAVIAVLTALPVIAPAVELAKLKKDA